MATDKKISYINQDGYKNYIKNSDSITIPKKFKARKKATSTHLAYITKAEAAQLKKQNKGTPHKGPKGIPSYDDYDASTGSYSTGAEMSAAETGGSGHGMSESRARDIRLGAVGAGAQGTKDEMKEARDIYGRSYRGRDRRTGIGGLLGGIGRGLLGFFGGIPGKFMSGILSARNLAKRTGARIGEFAETDEEGNPKYPTWDRYINRNTDKYKDKPYRGQGLGYDFSDTGQGNNLGLFTNTLNQPYVDEGRIGEYWRQPQNNNLGVNNQVIEEEQNLYPTAGLGAAEGGRIGYDNGGEVDSVKHAIMLKQIDKLEKMIASGLDEDGSLQEQVDVLKATPTTGLATGPVEEDEGSFWDFLPFVGKAQGGRIGYRTAGPVFGHDEPSEPILDFMQDQGVPFSEQVEGEEGILEQLVAKYIEAGFPPDQAEAMAMKEFQQMAMGSEQDQGIASLV
jgi:hypothetical protein